MTLRWMWLLVLHAVAMPVVAQQPAAGPATAPARTAIAASVRQSLELHADLPYARYGERALHLDLYRPKDTAGKLPALVCIHGGGWIAGDRRETANLAMALAARGYVTVNITYRLSEEAQFPAQIHDCKAAVRWVRANAATYGIDPGRIGAVGISSGGQLAALLATSGGTAELEGDGGNAGVASTIQAAVAMGGQTNMMSERNKQVSAANDAKGSRFRQYLGGSQAQRPEAYRLASPMHHLDAKDPPIALLNGANDDPSTRGDEFRAKMKELGGIADLKLIPDAPHSFLGRQAWFDQCLAYSSAFFDQHLNRAGGPR